MVDFKPAWVSLELQELLDRIEGPHAAKKRITVLRLAHALATGQAMASVFGQEDTCSRTTWYGRYRGGQRQPGWGEHSAIREALEAATRRAHYWLTDDFVVEQVQETRRRLANWGPPAADNLGLLMRKGSPADMRRATEAVLDRQGSGETASKATVPSAGETVVTFDLGGIPSDVLRALADGGERDETEAGGAD